jgi:Flp pilus assembly protein TadG
MVEVALMSPWILFLFMGVFDFGFYMYALICTENAARVGALYTSSSPATASDSAGACTYALAELSGMANVRSLANCNSSPLTVTASPVTAANSADGAAAASRVTVVYTTMQLIPIPWLTGQVQITRFVEMRVTQ